MDFKDTINKSNNRELYENAPLSAIRAISESRACKFEEEHYDTLKFEGVQERKEVKGDTRDNAWNGQKLKAVIYFILVLIIVLYVALLTLIIFLFVQRGPVDGQWTGWSKWTSCDVTCGNGTVLRTRRCTTSVPTDCVGDSLQSSLCFKDNCLVDGQWTNWSSWTSCDVTCGNGTHLRTRRCTNYEATNNGDDCIGDSLQSSQCSKDKCPVIMSAFSVTQPLNYNSIDGIRKLNFAKTIYQAGSDFNITTGTFTCNLPGVYQFSATLVKKRADTRVDRVYCYITKNSRYLILLQTDPTDDDTDKGSAAVSQSIVIDLDIGDTVYLTECIGQPKDFMESWSSFTGFLLYHSN